jgi:hypothetical protein
MLESPENSLNLDSAAACRVSTIEDACYHQLL